LNFFNTLQTIFDTTEQSLFQLSPKQQSAIEIGRNQITNGQFFENEAVITEMKEWLKKK
jgi:predicted transcriptional regulator